jgi:hypothetical protein
MNARLRKAAAVLVEVAHGTVGLGAEVLHEPRLWPEYHDTYLGTFVNDPDGNMWKRSATHRSDRPHSGRGRSRLRTAALVMVSR